MLPREFLQRLDALLNLILLRERALPRLLQRLLVVARVLGLGLPRLHLLVLVLLLLSRFAELAGRQLNTLDARVHVRRLHACVLRVSRRWHHSSYAIEATRHSQQERTPQTNRAPRSGTPRTAGRGRAP